MVIDLRFPQWETAFTFFACFRQHCSLSQGFAMLFPHPAQPPHPTGLLRLSVQALFALLSTKPRQLGYQGDCLGVRSLA